MLPKINRIRKKKDFEVIFKNSKSLKNNLFIFRITENNLGVNRFGFIVSKKVSKSAVKRNKIKRRMSEVIAEKIEKIKPNTDLVIIALPGIEKREFSEIKEMIGISLVKAKLIKGGY